MNSHAASLWSRASQALITAGHLCSSDPNAAASRAYYAAFYAVSCLLAEKELDHFTKHKAVEVFVHRDLVKTGLVDEEVGRAYSGLFLQRQVADYGGDEDISTEGARNAVAHAGLVVHAIARLLGLGS